MKNQLMMEMMKMLLQNNGDESSTKTDVTDKINEELYGKYIISRGYGSGVHFGILVSQTKDNLILKDSRRMWRFWNEKGIGLTDTAMHGLNNKDENKICGTIPLISITDNRIEEIIPCSEKAIESIKHYKAAEQY